MINDSNKNLFYNITLKSNPNFNIQISDNSLNIIKKFYGKEQLLFESFIFYLDKKISSIVTEEKTMNKELDDNEANIISERLSNLGKYFIIPESFKSLDEDKQYEQAIKLPGKDITHIMKKADINIESMIYYLGLQIVSHEINENIIINYYVLEKIFKLIYFLNIKFINKNNIDITFYSFRQILKKCGITLEEIIPFLHMDIKNIDRNNINYNEIPIIKSIQIREMKELISPEILNINFDIMRGTDSINRIGKNDFKEMEICRNEESNLLYEILGKIENKKNEIKNLSENEEYQIIEIKKDKNNNAYISRKTYDNLKQNNKNNINEIKIKDINNNDIILTKEIIQENEENKNISPLIIISNNKIKNEYILIPKERLNNKFKEFKYLTQEEIFSGKDINGKPKEIKGLFTGIQCEKISNIFISNKNKLPINKTENIIQNKEKLKLNVKQQDDIEPEYGNIMNPYSNVPFNLQITLKKELNMNGERIESKKEEEKLRNMPQREIKTYRIRRAVLFKRPDQEKEKQ